MAEEGLRFLDTGKPRYSGTSAPSTPAAMDRPSASSSSNVRVGVAGEGELTERHGPLTGAITREYYADDLVTLHGEP